MNMQPSEGARSRQVAAIPKSRRNTGPKTLLAILVGLGGLSPFASAQVFNDSGFGTELVATRPAGGQYCNARSMRIFSVPAVPVAPGARQEVGHLAVAFSILAAQPQILPIPGRMWR